MIEVLAAVVLRQARAPTPPLPAPSADGQPHPRVRCRPRATSGPVPPTWDSLSPADEALVALLTILAARQLRARACAALDPAALYPTPELTTVRLGTVAMDPAAPHPTRERTTVRLALV
jgi:hypothetical protein